jgi:ATP-dependent DNA ligase
VLNGELTIPNIRREVSNGIITSLVDIGASRAKGNDVYKDILKFEKKHGDYINVLNSIVFTVWDCITVLEYFAKGSKTPYQDRLKRLETLVSDLGEDSNVKVIEYKEVTTFAEVMEHYNEMSRRGEEGTVVKSFDGRWENKKPTYQVKVKKVEFLDLKIVGFNFGGKGTKNEHLISSLDVESSDGLLKTSPCGMDEQTMNDITENREKYLGTIVEVKCSGLSFDSEGNYSCMHPVFKRIRDDKTIANSLEECIEIDRMVTELGNGE